MTPEVPTGPETSPVDTTQLPILLVTRGDVQHHVLNFLGFPLSYDAFGNTSTVTKHVGTHT